MDEIRLGDIVDGEKNLDGKHKIVFLKDRDENFFIGCMLTHDRREGNVLMSQEHFEMLNEKGEPHGFQFDNTHLVQCLLLKRWEWEPFDSIGRLTESGIDFVRLHTKGTRPVTWEEARQGGSVTTRR